MKMLPGVNPRQAAKMMKRMGIQQQEIEATEVIIKTPEKTIIITNPSVSKVNMMGVYQIIKMFINNQFEEEVCDLIIETEEE
jgi:nascent polypeptide-associated complex subunit alpha